MDSLLTKLPGRPQHWYTLYLFLCWAKVVGKRQWAPTLENCPSPGGFDEELIAIDSRVELLIKFECVWGLRCHIFLPFHTVREILEARILEWLAVPSASEPCFVRSFFRTTTHNPISFCGSFNLAAGGLLKGFSGSFSLEWRTLKSSICWGFSFCKELEDIGVCIPWGGTRTPPQGCTVVSQLLLPCLCASSLLWLLLLFPCSVVSEALWPHGLQHTRLPYPSPSHGACSNSCPLSQWCPPTISSSVHYLLWLAAVHICLLELRGHGD